MTTRCIEGGKQGCHIKSQSWFNDKGVKLVVRKYIPSSEDKLSAQKQTKAIDDYLGLYMVTNTVQKILKTKLILGENSIE